MIMQRIHGNNKRKPDKNECFIPGLSFRFNSTEWEFIRKYAHCHGMSVVDYIVHAIDDLILMMCDEDIPPVFTLPEYYI